jgi:hypothetical protein
VIEETSELSASDSAETGMIQLDAPARGSVVRLPSSGARTSVIDMSQLRPPAAPLPAPMPRVDALPGDAFRFPAAALLPSPELASVHGGNTLTGSAAIDMRDTRGGKWTFAVLGVAALLGVIAAVAIQLAPSQHVESAAPAREAIADPPAAPRGEAVAVAPVHQETSPPAPVAETPPSSPTGDAVPVEDTTKADAAATAKTEKVEAPAQRKARGAAAPARSGARADALLRVITYNGVWAWAYVGNQRIDVPGTSKFKLPAGTYVVKLKNTDLGVTRSCKVVLEAGQVKTLKVEMEENLCDVD